MCLDLDSIISYDGSSYAADCFGCGRKIVSKYKSSVKKTVENGYCKRCYVRRNKSDVPKNEDGKWISHCPKCGVEQTYTRSTHAKASEKHGWTCRKCQANQRQRPVGNERRMYNKYKKSAITREIPWRITFKEFIGNYNGVCSMTGWEINMEYKTCNASLDRIDSSKGYEVGNLQWVHKMVNMTKSRYSKKEFVEMCVAVANKVRKNG